MAFKFFNCEQQNNEKEFFSLALQVCCGLSQELDNANGDTLSRSSTKIRGRVGCDSSGIYNTHRQPYIYLPENYGLSTVYDFDDAISFG